LGGHLEKVDSELNIRQVFYPFQKGCNKCYNPQNLQLNQGNTLLIAGLSDSSGVKIQITSQLRPIDGGYFLIGASLNGISLPPGNPDVEMMATCPSSQTQAPPANSVNPLVQNYTIFGSLLHMHQLGRQIWSEQYRSINGTMVKVGNIGCNDYFDFNQQQSVPLNVTFQPGDQFVTHCVWDTSSRQTTTLGCESTSCEMCFNYLAYYPKVVGDSCVTQPTMVTSPVQGDHCQV